MIMEEAQFLLMSQTVIDAYSFDLFSNAVIH